MATNETIYIVSYVRINKKKPNKSKSVIAGIFHDDHIAENFSYIVQKEFEYINEIDESSIYCHPCIKMVNSSEYNHFELMFDSDSDSDD